MSPPPQRISEREAAMHRLITPSARIISAMVILITGLGIASIFSKMPNGNEMHALYNHDVIDQDLAAVVLPNESESLISSEERAHISLPTLDIAPLSGSGTEKYTQIYEPPASLAARFADPEEADEEASPPPIVAEELLVSQKFEPMRQVADEGPLAVEPLDKCFPPKPESVSTAEKSDEMHAMFLFAENSRMELENSSEPAPPMDPFPVVSAPTSSSLQPLQPLHIGNLCPLLPL